MSDRGPHSTPPGSLWDALDDDRRKAFERAWQHVPLNLPESERTLYGLR